MSDYIIFPNSRAFELAQNVLSVAGIKPVVVEAPEFCDGLIAPRIEIAGGVETILNLLSDNAVPVAGTIPLQRINKEVPTAPPPEECYKEILGDISIDKVSFSLTNPVRFDLEIGFFKNIGDLIPLLPNFIKSGSHVIGSRVFCFNEGDRLICISEDKFILSRIEDLLDIWIILRSCVDLLISAWKRKETLQPVTESNYGVGAIEIYRRLPGTDCGICGCPNCMEFAIKLFMKKTEIFYCTPLAKPEQMEYLKSLCWLLDVMGIVKTTANEIIKSQDRNRSL